MSNSVMRRGGRSYFCLTCRRHHIAKVCRHCCIHRFRRKYVGTVRYTSGDISRRIRYRLYALERWLHEEVTLGGVVETNIREAGRDCSRCNPTNPIVDDWGRPT